MQITTPTLTGSSGYFDVTGYAALVAGDPMWSAQIPNADYPDEIELTPISCGAYALSATTIRVHWSSPFNVIGVYRFRVWTH